MKVIPRDIYRYHTRTMRSTTTLVRNIFNYTLHQLHKLYKNNKLTSRRETKTTA